MPLRSASPVRSPLILACLAATWLVWGSTYLAIKWALVSFPPLFQIGTRFVTAGLLLGLFMAGRGARWPSRDAWRSAFILGALVRVGRADYARMLKLIAEMPEIVNAWNITGEDSWVLQIAVTDVAHLDAVVSQMCLLAETSTSIILKTLREHQVMLPPDKEARS